ncbi:hypothetical protein HMPREF3138_15805 [Serratia sp. HMSC15F11]|nr:hypothetical protein HMPREF3138_15805 [Serratia sp. HMSC15F11]
MDIKLFFIFRIKHNWNISTVIVFIFHTRSEFIKRVRYNVFNGFEDIKFILKSSCLKAISINDKIEIPGKTDKRSGKRNHP